MTITAINDAKRRKFSADRQAEIIRLRAQTWSHNCQAARGLYVTMRKDAGSCPGCGRAPAAN